MRRQRRIKNRSVHYSPEIWQVCEAVAAGALRYGFNRKYDKAELANIVWFLQGRYYPKPNYRNCRRALGEWLRREHLLSRRELEAELIHAQAEEVEETPERIAIRKERIQRLRALLSGRELTVFDYCLKGFSLAKIGIILNISSERARQLRNEIIEKLKVRSKQYGYN